MSFFDGVWESSSDSQDFLNVMSGYFPTSSGINVNINTAMRHSIVYACVKVLSESISSLPLVLYKEDENGKREKAKKHPLYKLLRSLPNQEVTTMQWRETMTANLCLRGNHFSQIIRNNIGDIVSIWGLDSSRITAKRLQSTGEIVFIYDYGYSEKEREVKQRVFTFKEILNIAGLSFDGICGISPIGYQRESLALSMAMQEYGSKYFKNGASSSGVFSVEGELSDASFDRLKKSVQESYSELNAHKPMLLEGGAKFNPITMSNTDSQFLEGRRFSKEDIAMIFRVPLHMLNDLSKANYNSIEQLSLGFVTYTLAPWIVKIEQCMQRDLLTEKEREDGYYIKHNLSALLRGDAKSRAEYYKIMKEAGIFTIDDVLKLEDMNEIGGDVGGMRILPLNFARAEDIYSGKNLSNGGATNE